MGAKIIGFLLYLALSYGVIYALISKRFRCRLNIGEQQVRAAVLVAIAVIIALGTMLVQRFRNSNHIALIVGRAKSPGATDVTTLGDRAILPTLHMIGFMESVV